MTGLPGLPTAVPPPIATSDILATAGDIFAAARRPAAALTSRLRGDSAETDNRIGNFCVTGLLTKPTLSPAGDVI
jgi:hypothetical protein